MSQKLEDRVASIEKRNKSVEKDKAWETSWVRRLSIMGLTYIVVVVYLKFVVKIDPWVNGLVPVIGFLLSTLSLSVIKDFWQKRQK